MVDVLKTMRLARVGCLCNNDGKHAPIIDALDSSIKAVAELIEAAEDFQDYFHGDEFADKQRASHQRLKDALAAVTAHPNDAEGRT